MRFSINPHSQPRVAHVGYYIREVSVDANLLRESRVQDTEQGRHDVTGFDRTALWAINSSPDAEREQAATHISGVPNFRQVSSLKMKHANCHPPGLSRRWAARCNVAARTEAMATNLGHCCSLIYIGQRVGSRATILAGSRKHRVSWMCRCGAWCGLNQCGCTSWRRGYRVPRANNAAASRPKHQCSIPS
jgi:hypothetical protein